MSRKQKSKSPARKSGVRRVRLEARAPEAHEVFVAGTFNAWQPTSTALTQTGDGYWFAELSLSPGRYEYLFVVDGAWLPDPMANEEVPNPFGGANSVLLVDDSNGV